MQTDDEVYYHLKLALSENVGPVTFRDLMKYFKSAREAVLHLPEFAKRGGRARPIKIAADSFVEKQLEEAQKNNTEILTIQSPDYPPLLKEIEDRPPILFVKGWKNLLKKTAVGIVGSRNCSANGQNLTRKIAFQLAQNDYVVASGMARGIDSAAHEGALANTTDTGGTIAVLGTGVDKIYPKENEEIYQKIASVGCLISELPMGTLPVPAFFPRRNRIISGLSVGVLVIEANKLSGSLITARCALNQNREVFAVPGSPLDSRSEGPNRLIQEGAHLVTGAEDILRLLDFDTTKILMDSLQAEKSVSISLPAEQELTEARQIILDRLSPETTDVNQLIRGTGLRTDLVNIILVELELAGRIERFAGGKVALVYNNEWENA